MSTIIRIGGGSPNISNVKTLTTSQTWTVPAGITRLYLWMCGGGSQGAFGTITGSSNNKIYGGFSSMPREYVVSVIPGQQFVVTIGAAGGSDGGDTSFGSYTAAGAKCLQMNDAASVRVYGNASGGSVYGDDADMFTVQGAEGGDVGTLDAFGHSERRGYCWLTGSIYCGGGALFICSFQNGSHSSETRSGGPTTATSGGGVVLPYTTGTVSDSLPYQSMSVAGNIIPASGWGAGGVYVLASPSILVGDYAIPSKLLPMQGVCIIGY